MEIRYGLNKDCLLLHTKVSKFFIFDNDDVDTLIYELLGVDLKKTMGMLTIEDHTFQASYYTMPNGKVFAVAYATNEVVNFPKSEKLIKEFFKGIEFEDSSYQFYLTLLENGYVKRG
jgi:hypothetical protein